MLRFENPIRMIERSGDSGGIDRLCARKHNLIIAATGRLVDKGVVPANFGLQRVKQFGFFHVSA